VCCVCDDECATLGQALATGVSLNGKRGESDRPYGVETVHHASSGRRRKEPCSHRLVPSVASASASSAHTQPSMHTAAASCSTHARGPPATNMEYSAGVWKPCPRAPGAVVPPWRAGAERWSLCLSTCLALPGAHRCASRSSAVAFTHAHGSDLSQIAGRADYITRMLEGQFLVVVVVSWSNAFTIATLSCAHHGGCGRETLPSEL